MRESSEQDVSRVCLTKMAAELVVLEMEEQGRASETAAGTGCVRGGGQEAGYQEEMLD